MSGSSAHTDRARRRADPWSVVTAAAVGAGGVVGVLDDAAPTGLTQIDGFWRFGGGALIVFFAALAPLVAVAAAAAVATAASTDPILILTGAAGLVIAVGASRRATEADWPGAVVGLGVCFVAFNLPHDSFVGVATIVAIVAVAPLIIGALGWGPRWLPRVAGVFGTVLVLAVVVAGLGGVMGLMSARTDLERARDVLEEATEALGGGDTATAELAMARAIASLEEAEGSLDSVWARSGGGLPVLAQHLGAVRTVATHGVATVSAALGAVESLDDQALAVDNGRMNLAAVSDLAPSISRILEASLAAQSEVSGLDRTWLVAPLISALNEVGDRLADVSVGAQRGADAVALAPRLLGEDGLRRYVVLFVTPAEQRGSVGLIGNWALLEANAGQLRLVEVGRADDLNVALQGSSFRLSGPDAYVERYGANNIEHTAQDLTLSPHFPDVAKATAELFEEAKGVPIDGVGLIDPAGVAALLEVTGPIQVQGRRLGAADVRDFLLLGQYIEFETDVERIAFLAELLKTAFSEFLQLDVPDPWNLDAVFGNVIEEDRLMISSVHPEEELLLDSLGLSGAFLRRLDNSEDLFALVTQNAGENKIDVFLERSVRYEPTVDPISGALSALVVVDLTNGLDNLSLPAAIIGSADQGFEVGTNRTALTIYTPHRLVSARVDGEDVGVQSLPEFGLRSFGRQIDIAPGQTVRVEFQLRGELSPADAYRLLLPVQPGARNDDITVVFRDASAAAMPPGGVTTTTVTGAADLIVEVPFEAAAGAG